MAETHLSIFLLMILSELFLPFSRPLVFPLVVAASPLVDEVGEGRGEAADDNAVVGC